MSSLALGASQIGIERGLTTSSTAIFVPFTTCELFREGGGAVLWTERAFQQPDHGEPQEFKEP